MSSTASRPIANGFVANPERWIIVQFVSGIRRPAGVVSSFRISGLADWFHLRLRGKISVAALADIESPTEQTAQDGKQLTDDADGHQ